LEHLNFFLNCASNFEKNQTISRIGTVTIGCENCNIGLIAYVSVCSKKNEWSKSPVMGLLRVKVNFCGFFWAALVFLDQPYNFANH